MEKAGKVWNLLVHFSSAGKVWNSCMLRTCWSLAVHELHLYAPRRPILALVIRVPCLHTLASIEQQRSVVVVGNESMRSCSSRPYFKLTSNDFFLFDNFAKIADMRRCKFNVNWLEEPNYCNWLAASKCDRSYHFVAINTCSFGKTAIHAAFGGLAAKRKLEQDSKG